MYGVTPVSTVSLFSMGYMFKFIKKFLNITAFVTED